MMDLPIVWQIWSRFQKIATIVRIVNQDTDLRDEIGMKLFNLKVVDRKQPVMPLDCLYLSRLSISPQ